jgi:hypothetical protein
VPGFFVFPAQACVLRVESYFQLLNGELNKMVAKPQIVAKFAELGAEPLRGTPIAPPPSSSPTRTNGGGSSAPASRSTSALPVARGFS